MLILLLLTAGLSYSSAAQSPWLSRTYPNSVSIEWYKPVFNPPSGNDNITFFSSVLFVTGRYQATENLWLVGDLPFSHWEYEDPDGVDTQAPHTTLGNVYLGGEYHFPDRPGPFSYFAEFGLRLPTLAEPDFPDKRGAFTGYYTAKDRRGAFFHDLLPLTGMGNLLYHVNDVFTLRLRGGFAHWIYTGDATRRGNRLFLAQSVQAHFQTRELSGHFGITGRYDVDTDDDITQLQAGLSRSFNGWTGTFYLRRPLEGDSFVRVYGVTIDIAM